MKWGKGKQHNYDGNKNGEWQVIELLPDGKDGELYQVSGSSTESWDNLCNDFGVEMVNGKERVRVPKDVVDEFLETTTVYPSRKSPLMCNFTAVKEYCESLLGIKLSEHDREFFVNHPLVEIDGVPMMDTLRVTQELIAPYGLGISRVQMTPGMTAKGDLAQWRRVLGTNVLALTDKATTNAQFAEQSGLPVPEAEDQYRFEHTTKALSPAVCCGIMSGNNSAVTGLSGGHAHFAPPRQKMSGTMLSFQIDRIEKVRWLREPVFAEVSAPDSAQPKTVTKFVLYRWNLKAHPYKVYDYRSSTADKKDDKKEDKKPGTAITRTTIPICQIKWCTLAPDDQTFGEGVPGVCYHCWHALWESTPCLGPDNPKQPRHDPVLHMAYNGFSKRKGGEIYGKCPHCAQVWKLGAEWAEVPEFVDAISAVLTHSKSVD